MERDFMGLSSKDSVIMVKEEPDEVCKEAVFSKSSAVQWPMSSKVSQVPLFMSLKVAQEETALGDVQMLQGANHAVQANASHPFLKAHFSGAAQNFTGAPMNQAYLGGIAAATPRTILPSAASFAGMTEPWTNMNATRGPAQLTIFYGGVVNVYDDISPEKAQAIMLLAGNGSPAVANMAQPKTQAQTPPLYKAAAGPVFANQPIGTPPCSALSSPISVSSHPIGQPGFGPTSFDEVVKAPIGQVYSPAAMTSLGPITLVPSAVPQARKASLARFLEKRKERVMSSAPYNLSKKSGERDASPATSVAAAQVQ